MFLKSLDQDQADSQSDDLTWNVMDVGSIWMKEFASALNKMVSTRCWEPKFSAVGAFQTQVATEHIDDPQLDILRFPLQRGYARSPISRLLPYERSLFPLMQRYGSVSIESPLICTTPYYAPLAEKWRGPVVYYATDLTVAYAGVNPHQVQALDRRLCRRADAVCPNSKRIADYFVRDAGCETSKITIVPNATRQMNIAGQPLLEPTPLPADAAHLQRPIAGVIGNLSANMNWLLIAESIRLTPEIHWLFVGPTTMAIPDPKQAAALEWVQQNALFVGSKPYAELQAYARSFDVAVLPYMRKEPTFSGSSTRFYEHLAACRPMIATRGFAELLEKPPLLTLADTAAELRDAMTSLASVNFRDGFETARWMASKSGTWEERARAIVSSIHESSMGA
jgi:glycosyltransferase involved in cell wall biosynthesis